MPPDPAHRARPGAPLVGALLLVASLVAPRLGSAHTGDSAAQGSGPAAPAVQPVKAGGPQPDFGEVVPPAPTAFDGVGLTEHLGAKVPLDLAFRDHTGKAVVLGDLIRGDLPTILTFNYSDCPMLCSMQLNGLLQALPELTLMAGRQFRIITVIIEPLETPERAARTRQVYLDRLPPTMKAAASAGGWTFLVAPSSVAQTAPQTAPGAKQVPNGDASIRRLAETVGFGYKFVPERNEWAHPAALIFLSPSGAVTRYLGDVHYPPELLTKSIMLAGTSEPSSSAGFIMSCFHYDADVNNYSRFGVDALRYAAVGFLLLMLTVFGIWRLLRRPSQALPGVDRS
jgi:protein SCO1